MDVPSPTSVVALAALVRDRLAAMTEALLSEPREAVRAASRTGAATTIIGAAAPFAPTSYARLRLIRQLHASGMLSEEQARRTHLALTSAPDQSAPDQSTSDQSASDQMTPIR